MNLCVLIPSPPDRFSLPPDFTRNADAVTIQVYEAGVTSQLLESIFLLKHPKEIKRLKRSVSIRALIDAVGDTAEITMTSDYLALFVVLTCRAQGRFSDNAFVLRPGKKKVSIPGMQSMRTSPNSDPPSVFARL